MLNAEEIELLADQVALRKASDSPLYIWVVGMSGAGKTFVLGRMASTLRQQTTVLTFNDWDFIYAEVLADTEQLYHRTMPDGMLLLTNSHIFEVAIDKLVATLPTCTSNYVLIELGRGTDKHGLVNYGYSQFFPKVSSQVMRNSVFLYLVCPFEERVRRNLLRSTLLTTSEGGHQLPQSAMEDRNREDDIHLWIDYLGPQIIMVDNS